MAHPDWVLKHKRPNTEIRCIRGRYYLYNITSVWCPEKKRTKKKTLNQVGVIDPEHGLIPTGMSRRGRIPKGASKLKETPNEETNFLDDFSSMEDPRSSRNQLYSLSEILLVTFLAVMCGAEGWRDIENYGNAKIDFLKNYLPYENGTPSDDTIRRLFRHLNPDTFQHIFSQWVRNIAELVDAQVIAIDGKSHRRSYEKDGDMLHMVSAFAADARVVLGQQKTDCKSNEITAIPMLLELLDIKGHIITIDAMGCQHTIAKKILDKESDYIFSLKGNQGNLCQDVTLFFEDQLLTKNLPNTIQHDKGHGRLESRECFVCSDVQWLRERHPNWSSIQSIIKINASRKFEENSKNTQETRYFISSLKNPTPDAALIAIRQHWGIENSLHWVLDMSFNEDYSRIRKGNAPQIMSIIRHVAINLLQRYKSKRQSIKGLRKMCAWDNKTLADIIAKEQPQEESS